MTIRNLLHPPRTEIPAGLGSCCNVVVQLGGSGLAHSLGHIHVLHSQEKNFHSSVNLSL
jgi:hypothetical protein